MKIGISKNVPHTYIQYGTRFFGLLFPVQETVKQEGVEKVIDAHNFYVFSENGFCWLELIHVDESYVLNQLGNGFFKTRHIIEIDAPMPAYRDPIVETDEWIQGNSDRGYALEIIREGLGLNLTYLKPVLSSGEKVSVDGI